MTCPLDIRGCSQARFVTDMGRRPTAVCSGFPADQSMDELLDEFKRRFEHMQDCICALLIKNQQLRMALMEAKTAERRSASHSGDGR